MYMNKNMHVCSSIRAEKPRSMVFDEIAWSIFNVYNH